MEPCWLNERDIYAIYGEIIAESGGAYGVLNKGAIESTLNKPKNLYYYSNNSATLYELAAAYGYGFLKNHCFVDGNKRIALIVVYTFLAVNGIELIAPEMEAADLFLNLAASNQSQEEDMKMLADWLVVNSELICEQ